MEWLLWIGSGLTLIGVVILGYCIVSAYSAKRAGLSDDEIRAGLQRVVVINMVGLLVSGLGLMSVVVGILLG